MTDRTEPHRPRVDNGRDGEGQKGMPSQPSMTRPLAGELVDRLVRSFEAARGFSMPTQRALGRAVLAGLPKPTEDDLHTVALACWQLDEREYQYFVCDYLRTHRAVPGPAFLSTARTLITTKSWWDTVDPLATRFVGELVRRHPKLSKQLDAWSTDKNMWLVRTAILHQMHYRDATNTERLFGYCTRQAGHPDFFVRKAIGWALREYAYTDADAVRKYVAKNRAVLSPLSVREASKHL
jgi:3-methyladenine DNA glycosylase AlkD